VSPQYRYHPQILDALAGHGLVPRSDTSPDALRDAVRDLYKYEIRRLRDSLLAGQILKGDYADHVIALRRRYPVLSVPTELWLAPGTEYIRSMQDFEKLGLFYLGRRYDMDARKTVDEPVLYESRDLVTHAVCVGMTGSGKTGLCLSLIEEAAIDAVPVIAIDPKGDLGNLLLTFPELSAKAFRPWIDEDEARRAGQDPDTFAAAEADRWRKGLADWGQDEARVRRLRESAEFAIYTPGSKAGLPVSILSSFAAPLAGARDDAEALAERAGSTATGLLALAGVDAQPRSREHTLLATLFATAWADGKALDLAALIQQVQSPPIQRVGVVDLEAFFPAKERFDLAMRLNGLLAAPGFAQWMEGAPLDIAGLLHTPQGTPRVVIFSIAHLGDAERMFFVSLLLNQLVSWMRGQTGTTSLRAILYMDEILGYFPPVANPASKGPLLTLLKQGRAFGIGVVLATQNPVDLDYKGLANTGTWFLGRLQTERDKARMLDGLEGAAGGSMDRAETDRLLSALDKRVFLLHNVHQKAPSVFQTRWTLSYLRGPLSRDQIRALTPAPPPTTQPSTPEPVASATARKKPAAQSASSSTTDTSPPVLPPGIQQFFVPAADSGSGAVHYSPVVLGAARVGFGDSKLGVDEVRDVLYAVPMGAGPIAVDWSKATRLEGSAADLRESAPAGATFAQVPAAGLQAKSYGAWEKDFSRWLAQSERLELMRMRELKLTSKPGESERDFTIRAQDAQRAARDAAVDAIRSKYGAKQAQFAEQRRRAEAAVERESSQATQQKLQTGLSMGATILGALFGKKTISAGTLGRATTAARGVGRTMKETEDIKRASDNVEAIRERERALEAEILEETKRITEASGSSQIERLQLSPKRGQISVQLVGLGWLPE
jgi:hypothetical protein